MEQRREIIKDFTNDRTNNSSDLYQDEIDELIYLLNQSTPLAIDHSKGDFMRKRILKLCYQIGYTSFDQDQNKHIVDMNRLNNWMLNYSYLRKPLNQYSYSELIKLVNQFSSMSIDVLNRV